MSETFHNAFMFLLNTVFDLYLFVITLRIILVWVKANYFLPTTQFIVKLSDFIVKPLRRFIPNVGRVELASVVLLLTLEIIKFIFICMLSFGFPTVLGLLVLAFGDAIKMFLETFFYAILIQAIISFVQPNSPLYFIIRQITSPIMQPLQRIIPPVGGFDITPIPALILLQLLIIIVAKPLMQMGLVFALGA